MIRALVTGTLSADPVQRTARNGNSFALARLSVPMGDAGRIHCSLIAFEERAVKRLLELREGASVSAAGTLKVSIWTPDKEDSTSRPQLDLQADEIAATTPRPKTKRTRNTRAADRDSDVDWLGA